MKVCIIGNSHLAALKLALCQGLTQDQGHDCIFWGAKERSFWKTFMRDGVLYVPRDVLPEVLWVSNDRCAHVDPRDFDAIVFHGVGLGVHNVAYELAAGLSEGRHYSKAVVRASTEEWMLQRKVVSIAREMRSRSQCPIAFSMMPSLSEDAYGDEIRIDVPGELRRAVDSSLQTYILSQGFCCIPQPEVTLSSRPNFTKREYSIGSTRLIEGLDTKHREREYVHMNSAYGAKVMESILEAIPAKVEVHPTVTAWV